MSIDNVYSSIKGTVKNMSPKNNSSVFLGRINSIDYKLLKADVYIYEASTVLKDIPICFPSKGKGYGSYFMPKENSTCILVLTANGKYYIIAGATPSLSRDNESQVENVLSGENFIQSAGDASIRQDCRGNTFILSPFGNSFITSYNGINKFYSNGKEEKTISSKSINGFELNLNTSIDNNFLNSEELKLINMSEYYSSISNLKVYKSDELLETIDDVLMIKQDIKTEIINKSKSIIDSVNGAIDSLGLKEKMLDYKIQIKNIELTDEELADKIIEIFNSISNDFNVPKTGIKVKIEKGNVINKELDSISDISKLTSDDFEKSSLGNNLCFKLSVTDISNNTVKASMSIDIEGNCFMKFKTLKIETDNDTYNF